MRGKLVYFPAAAYGAWITPAGAGKTGVSRRIQCCLQDHPRRCGENEDRITEESAKAGSPPQVRGKRVCRRNRHVKSGITPAGAGKTRKAQQHKQTTWDHPRRCGENERIIEATRNDIGSPPQVRGKPHVKLLSHTFTKDHPRRCGENA